MKEILKKSAEKSITYQEYVELVKGLLVEGKSTGFTQTEALTNYSMLNDKRMNRLDKTIKIFDDFTEAFQQEVVPQTWLVITEGWCGDAAQNLPVIKKIADQNPNINLKLILRDENDALMQLFLTNGNKAIPKLIALDTDFNVLFTWGPRPTIATKMVLDYKNEFGVLDAKFKQDLQVWYNKNKGKNLQEDFVELLNKTAIHTII